MASFCDAGYAFEFIIRSGVFGIHIAGRSRQQPYSSILIFTEKALLPLLITQSFVAIMSSSIKNVALLALATGIASVASAQATSGSGHTTRYW